MIANRGLRGVHVHECETPGKEPILPRIRTANAPNLDRQISVRQKKPGTMAGLK
jgi:hypothetical protein